MVAAVGPSEEEQKREKDLRREVETSKLELKNQREEFDMKLRSLRQEHERVVSDMEKQLRDLKRLKKYSGRTGSSTSKKKENVDSTSKFWRKKMKDLKQSYKKEREVTISCRSLSRKLRDSNHNDRYRQCKLTEGICKRIKME